MLGKRGLLCALSWSDQRCYNYVLRVVSYGASAPRENSHHTTHVARSALGATTFQGTRVLSSFAGMTLCRTNELITILSLDRLSRFTQLAWKQQQQQKNRRLSFLTPPPLWIEFPGDFFAGFLQAPSLFDHRRLPIYGLYVYSFCKCKVISVEMVRIRSEESTRCIIFICHHVTPHPPPPTTK